MSQKTKVHTCLIFLSFSFNTKRLSGSFKVVNDDRQESIEVGIGVQDGNGYKDNTNNRGANVYAILGKRFGNTIVKFLTVSGGQSNDLGWLGALESDIEQNRAYNQNSPDEDDDFFQSVNAVSSTTALSPTFTVNASAYYNYLNGNYDFDLNRFLYMESDGSMFNYALQHDMIGGLVSLNYSQGLLDVTNGYHISNFQRDHTGSLDDVELYTNSGTKKEYNTSLNVEYGGDFKLFGNAQVRRATFDYVGDTDFEQLEWDFLNYQVGVRYNGLYYSYGTTGREPARTDLFGGEDNFVELVDVEPERANNHELGYRTDNLSVNVYHMSFENEIVLNGQYGPNSLPIRSNVASSTRMGVETQLEGSVEQIQYRIAYTYSNNTVEQENVEFNHVLSPENILSVNLTRNILGVDVSTLFRYQSSMNLDLANEFEVDGYTNLDIVLSREITDDLTLTANVNNVLNNDYFTYGSVNVLGEPTYFTNASANFLATLEWRF